MAIKVHLVLPLTLSIIFYPPEISPAQIDKRNPCKHPIVHYEPFNEDSYGFENITFTEIDVNDDFPSPADSAGRTHTPMETRWFVADEPDFTEPGPWNTRVYIGNKAGVIWTMKFANHSTYGVNVNWINEHLLFARAWWGRIVSTDLVFDTESGTYVYRRQANYDELIMNCPDSTQQQH